MMGEGAPERALVALIAAAAAEVAAGLTPPRLPLCLSYAAAGEQLGVSARTVQTMADRGQLDRPEWTGEVRAGVVTTVSVARAAGWPVVPIEVVVPSAA